MSLYPWRPSFPRWWDWDDWHMMDTPSRIFDQHFGTHLDHGHHHHHQHGPHSQHVVPYWMQPGAMSHPQGRGAETGMSEVINDQHKFQINLDVSHFSPEEIQVKTVDNHLLVEGKHEERQDEHGYISRHFTRKYVLPKNVDPSTVTSSLSHEGTLSIRAPKIVVEGTNERPIPIQLTPKPAEENNK